MPRHPLHLEWRQRRQRLRRLLKPLPRRANVGRYPLIKWFAERARRAPWLWSFKRAQIVPALYVGSVLSFLPVYGLQILIALGAALLLRANLTVLVALQMIVNPLTLVPIYAFTGWVGLAVMDVFGIGLQQGAVLRGANALFIGGTAVGLGFAVLADVTWRVLAWEARRFRAQLAAVHNRAADISPVDPS